MPSRPGILRSTRITSYGCSRAISEPLVRVLGRTDFMTLLGEQQGATLAHDLFVIDNQDRRVFHVDLAAIPQDISADVVQWHRDREGRTFPRSTVDRDATSMPLDDSVRDRQSQSRALPDVLGSEERIEYLPDILGRNTDARVAEHDLDRIAIDDPGATPCRPSAGESRMASRPPSGMASPAFTSRFTKTCCICPASTRTCRMERS